MQLNDSLLQPGERISLQLRELYAARGYAPFKMSKFEEYDLYARNKEFLVSDNVITFTDTDGRLMALKPDVTLSIIKNTRECADGVRRIYYNENVYRVSRGTGAFREIMQSGVECMGNISAKEAADVILLAAESLSLLSDRWELDLSDLSLPEALVEGHVPAALRADLYRAVGQRNEGEIRALCARAGTAETADALISLLSARGNPADCAPLFPGSFGALLRLLAESPLSSHIRVDFSLTADTNYYNGAVFKGYLGGTPDPVLSGGMYDRLMQKMHRRDKAIGFAVYTDAIDRVDTPDEALGTADAPWLNVALPKGRLGEKVYEMFAAAGFECPALLEPSRKLIFENAARRVRYFWVKPSDVAIYVERGAADVGVAGKDILLEYNPDVLELLDLKLGKCRMAVAAPREYDPEKPGTVRVATKFSNIAAAYYRSVGRDIDIIHLNGSIEIAPILGLSDVIVDIVETGTTLRENNLEVKETILPISARLISNKSSFRFKNEAIEKLTAAMRAAVTD